MSEPKKPDLPQKAVEIAEMIKLGLLPTGNYILRFSVKDRRELPDSFKLVEEKRVG